jgi:hypothetical protein
LLAPIIIWMVYRRHIVECGGNVISNTLKARRSMESVKSRRVVGVYGRNIRAEQANKIASVVSEIDKLALVIRL